MGTPLRFILSPKLLSPISPKSPLGFGKLLESKANERVLDFPKKVSLASPSKELQCVNTKKTQQYADIKIKITDLSDRGKSLIVKTPEKFEILENGLGENNFNVLGKGGFGTVVTGIYKNRDVAVKVVKLGPNEELREAKILNLEHRNIIKTIDVIVNSNMNYAIIVMEHINSLGHLQNILDDENCKLSEASILKYALDVTRGLNFCHENALVHMDLKPANILICQDDSCKICDFGNCYNVQTDRPEDYKHRGTISYTAPEILLGRKPRKECDIYSLGIMLWQMVTRRIPYEDIRIYEVIVYKVVKFNLRPDTNCQNTNQFLRNLYVKCWSTNPDDRPSCFEIERHLLGLSLA